MTIDATALAQALAQLANAATIQSMPPYDPRVHALQLLAKDSRVQAAIILAVDVLGDLLPKAAARTAGA